MSGDGEKQQIDANGRLPIPERIRERLDLEPGEQVRVDIENGTVVVRPYTSWSTFIESMQGCITAESKPNETPTVSPETITDDWTADLPDRS